MDHHLELAQSYFEGIRQAFVTLGDPPVGDSDLSHQYIERMQDLLGQLELARRNLAAATSEGEYPNPKDMAEVNATLLEGKLHRRILEAAAPLSPIVPSLVPFKEASLEKSLDLLKKVALLHWIDDETREEQWWEIAHVASAGGDRKELREALRTVAAFKGTHALEAIKKLQLLDAMEGRE